ncbi:murein hydrolase activator EnvC family protein [Numidum massiliense]|uniref:murein hydrolase activator EnvC family protein n=1 Tax=Numidum massiliense TaxID=1522315 RepID=UPI0006D5970A|nr:M23 family metallopeptidase [Numidum massiliense]
MRKKLLPIVLSGALTLTLALPPYTAHANADIDLQISELREKIRQGEGKQVEAQKKLDENRSKQEAEKQELSRIEGELKKTKEKIRELNDKISKTEKNLEKAKRDLAAAKKRVAEREQFLNERVRLIYEKGEVSYLEVLLQSTSFSDFLARFEALRAVSEQDYQMLEDNRRDHEKIKTAKAKIEKSLVALGELRKEVKAERSILAKQEKEHQATLASLQKEGRHLDHMNAQEAAAMSQLVDQLAKAEAAKAEWQQREEQRKREEAEQKRQEAERQKRGAEQPQQQEQQQDKQEQPQQEQQQQPQQEQQQPNKKVAKNPPANPPQQAPSKPAPSKPAPAPAPAPKPSPPAGGQFGWAVPGYHHVSSGFGWRWGAPHNGIDIPAPIGTPIVAIADGTVTAAGPASGFGNWVVIYHGNGYSSVYGHMRGSSIKVRAGQRVSRGQHIAGVGNEGFSTGPHLHLEIHQNGRPLNPMRFY